MKVIKFYYGLLILPVALILSSCSNNSAKADDPKVLVMDSISTELESTNKELDEKTSKLEESLKKAEELETKK
ncbi:hypothetical protein ACFSJU_03140 [Paradesertivirga mongoliensis]|uniref:Uncharacterized protein n=1 Tax=Paradesertivirga mongoliensis TaxID=2100740 RepID=A0ABW4ZHQ7_9SPHI|nr:hypothetical protein [Pedobacter mongoliensis]